MMAGPRAHPQSRVIVAAARACIGTRFRSQGRVPGLALDCVGVALVAARAAGLALPNLPLYQLGGDNEALIDTLLAQLGLRRVAPAAAGDVWLFAPAQGQRHLAVQVSDTPCGSRSDPQFVHAHAGVGRVVEAPADPAWALLGSYRFPEGC